MSNNYFICKIFKYKDLNNNSFLYLNDPEDFYEDYQEFKNEKI